MSNTEIEQRVADLEIQIAFQDDHIQKLNEALVDQQTRIQALEVGLRHYEKRLQELQDVGESSVSDNQPPPHY